MLANFLQKCFTITTQDILLTSLETVPPLTLNQDYLRVSLSDTLFKTIQIDTTRDTHLSSDEQLRWEMNTKLPQTIENYIVATTIYFQDAQTLKALGAAFENKLCTKLLSAIENQGILVKEITSADKQFTFYKKNIPFYKLPLFLKKVDLALGILGVLCILVSGLLFMWHDHNAPAQNKQLQETTAKLQKLETKYTQYLNYKEYHQTLLKNKQRLTGILKILHQLKSTPKEIILDEINFAPDQTITIRGASTSDKAIEQFGKALKKIASKATLLVSTHTNTKTDFEFFIPPSRINLKGKKNGDY